MVKKWRITIPTLSGDETRRVYLYLPESYQREPDRRYPVMYMFDGHNVFFDRDATYGKSWGMHKYLGRSRTQLIVVAVECNHKGNGRLQEYSPFDFSDLHMGKVHGKGALYMQWLTETLKPWIDANYRTLPSRENTLICGSSMGGLMALYGACAYNHIFQRAACLSPSLWLAPEKVSAMVRKADICGDTCIYMDYGSQEMGNHVGNLQALTETSRLLMGKGVNLTTRIVPDGSHCEASWERQIPVFMSCLGI